MVHRCHTGGTPPSSNLPAVLLTLQTVLTPHLPLLLLQTSSALSHIFPEIRLDACKLVALLLEHVPTHVVGSWPASTSTASSSKNTLDGGNIILEGLRLAVGLGGEKGASSTMGKLGSTGRLTTLSTLLSFTKCALEKDMVDTDGIFADWVPGSEGKGKGRAVDVSLNTVWPEGWLVGPPSWGLDNDVGTWDVSRLNGAGLEDEEGQGDAVVVSFMTCCRISVDDIGPVPSIGTSPTVHLFRVRTHRFLPLVRAASYPGDAHSIVSHGCVVDIDPFAPHFPLETPIRGSHSRLRLPSSHVALLSIQRTIRSFPDWIDAIVGAGYHLC